MINKALILIVLCCQLITGQEIVEKTVFENLKEIKVISTEVIEKSQNNNVAALKFKFIDLSDMKIKFYLAELDKREYVSISKWKKIFGLGTLFQTSVINVPFKIRSKNRQGYVTAQADVKNVGILFPFATYENKRYWIDNTTSVHKFSFGLMIAPMAQELNDKNTNNYFQNANISFNSFMMSTSLTATYTYNSITIAFIPVGFDFGLDKAGKNWDNHGKYWTGIGIGVDSKLFGF